MFKIFDFIFVEFSLLAEADYVICIDAIGQGTELNLHVSKPPKEGTQAYALVQVRTIFIVLLAFRSNIFVLLEIKKLKL